MPIVVCMYALLFGNSSDRAEITVDSLVVAKSQAIGPIGIAHYGYLTAIVPNNSSYKYFTTYTVASYFTIHELSTSTS